MTVERELEQILFLFDCLPFDFAAVGADEFQRDALFGAFEFNIFDAVFVSAVEGFGEPQNCA